ncbi:MAG: bifunctional riboflavin kinase/FAD synthetase [Clostridiales bacterium]|nr:bifunctional riboflavin kinase/FAD synthetase [Clostridiales bacterium]
MEVIFGRNSEIDIQGPTGVGLGNFDGLHVGHMALINTLISESRLNRYNSLLYTFTKHPENILRKKLFTPLLTTVNKKIQLLSETQLKYLDLEEFDEYFSHMKPEDFVKEVLVGKLKARLAVAGFDYRFGYRGQGNIDMLAELGKHYGMKVIVISPIKIDNTVVSSTLIRESVAKGDMEKVFKLLGRHHSITGEVQTGRQVGSKIGFPTANLHPEPYLILPQNGVYITRTLLDGEFYPSITNVGLNPTFGDVSNVKVETHIINFKRDIYNRNIEVFFLSKLRGEKKFKSKEELIAQIQSDLAVTREYFGISEV